MRRQRGFSLLEVLVAFVLLALTLGLLMNIFSRASRTATLTTQYSQAAALAEAKLAAVGVEMPLEEGTLIGEPENGFAWEISVMPVDLTAEMAQFATTAITPTTALFRVTATVLWLDGGRARRLTFTTQRLVPAETLENAQQLNSAN